MKRTLLRSPAFGRDLRRWLKSHPDAAASIEEILEQLSADAAHRSLRTHRLRGPLAECWACSAGYDLRVVFQFVKHKGKDAILLEGVGTSPEVNALRSRTRREIADLLRDLWREYDPEAAASSQAPAISVGVFGILFESMVHLAETGHLDDAPSHVPALVTAVNRVITPNPAA